MYSNKMSQIIESVTENWHLFYINIDLYIYVFFSALIIINSLAVILVRNPIHSVLYLILTFLCVGLMLILLKSEFLAFLFFIVYLGAISVLFIFVVMMLNIRMIELREDLIRYLPLSSLIFLIFILLILFLINNSNFLNTGDNINVFSVYTNWFVILENITNIEAIGMLVYTHYIYCFLLAGIVLLLAMLGAIILTLNQLRSFKRQYHHIQNRRNVYNSLHVIKM